MSSADCLVKKDGPFLWITLNRPEVSNAISIPMVDILCQAIHDADDDDEIKVVIITGAGKNFCAGGDLNLMKEQKGMFSGDGPELARRYQKGIQRIPMTLERFQKPVIAMLNGAAAGACLDLACMCDIRLCSPEAKFTESFSKLSLVPGDGGTFFLQRIVGYPKAMEMFLTANLYDAEQALKMNLVHEISADKDLKTLQELTLKWAKTIASRSLLAQMYTKMALKRAGTESCFDQLDLLAHLQGLSQRSDDHLERMNKLKE